MRHHDGCARNFVGTSHGQNFGETGVLTFHYRVGGALLVLRVTVFSSWLFGRSTSLFGRGGLNEQGTHGRNYNRADLLFDHIF